MTFLTAIPSVAFLASGLALAIGLVSLGQLYVHRRRMSASETRYAAITRYSKTR
jgi:hypothetical protein